MKYPFSRFCFSYISKMTAFKKELPVSVFIERSLENNISLLRHIHSYENIGFRKSLKGYRIAAKPDF